MKHGTDSAHFRDTFQGTGFKAQLVTQDKATALLYKAFLDEIGMVTSEVLISGPDEREGYDDVDDANKDKVVAFWKKMMARFGTEKEYNRQLINAFTKGEEPEIIIVVDKLLTGFDAPRNVVLYLTRKLKDHTLLQAIARVNRLHEGKDYGYIIDYRGVLQNLDRALDLYGQLADFDPADLEGTLTDVGEVIRGLPQLHSDLWQVFNEVENRQDEEAYERLLADEALRHKFYERLSAYARTLDIALSTVSFIQDTPEKKLGEYTSDLKFFMNLRTAVRRRYAEVVDFSEYEPKIQKLIDTHVGTGEVEKLTGLVNIFDTEAFAHEVEQLTGTASKADTIAHRTMRTIHERMEEDPAFYRKFSELLEEAIRAFREQRISDLEYLNAVQEMTDSVRNRTGDEIPARLQHHDVAKAYYGVVQRLLEGVEGPTEDPGEVGAEIALRVDQIIEENRIVNWTNNGDVQNRMRTDIEDCLFELQGQHGFQLSFDAIDEIMEQCLDIARVRRP